MWKARCRLLEALLAALVAAAPGLAQEVYLHVIPVTATPELAERPEAPLRVALTLHEPETFRADLLEAFSASRVESRVIFDLRSYPQFPGAPGDDHLKSTFIIDFAEPEVEELARDLIERHGEAPSVEELRRFTEQAITDKTLARGWDLASQIARRREGDCTEHAVLLTALARRTGRPARVVVGVALLWLDGSISGYGHAWSEIHDGTRWQRVDATGIDQQTAVRYLPLLVIHNEGPGYSFHMTGDLLSAWPVKIELESAARAQDPEP